MCGCFVFCRYYVDDNYKLSAKEYSSCFVPAEPIPSASAQGLHGAVDFRICDVDVHGLAFMV